MVVRISFLRRSRYPALCAAFLALATSCRPAAAQGLRQFIGHTGAVTSVAFSPDGRTVVTGSTSPDRTVRLWDISTGAELRRFVGHSETVWSVAFSPDGHTILTGGGDKSAWLWEVPANSVSAPAVGASLGPAPPLSSTTGEIPEIPSISGARNSSRRIALIIGNSAYEDVSTLPNPRRDAKAVAVSLRSVGFEIVAIKTT